MTSNKDRLKCDRLDEGVAWGGESLKRGFSNHSNIHIFLSQSRQRTLQDFTTHINWQRYNMIIFLEKIFKLRHYIVFINLQFEIRVKLNCWKDSICGYQQATYSLLLALLFNLPSFPSFSSSQGSLCNTRPLPLFGDVRLIKCLYLFVSLYGFYFLRHVWSKW